MSILNTFFVLFDTDAKKAEEEMGAAEAQADSLAAAMEKVGAVDTADVAKLDGALDKAGDAARDLQRETDKAGVSADGLADDARRAADKLDDAADEAKRLDKELSDADRTAAHLGKSFTTMAKSLAGPLLTLVSIGTVISAARTHIDATLQLIERAARARIDVSTYDAWRRAIRAAGGDAARAEGQFEAFADKVTEAFGDVESEAGKALKAMGVGAADAEGNIKSTDAALLDLADAMSKVSKQTAVDSLRRLGIVDPTMVEMILQGRDGLQKMLETQRKNGALTMAQAKAYKDFRTAINTVSDAMRTQMDAILGRFLPGLTAFLLAVVDGTEAFGTLLRDNAGVLEGFGVALALVAGVVLATYVPAMTAAAIATLGATWPIIALVALIGALAAAFALAYDDVKAFLNGQPSMLGELVEKYGWVRDAVIWIAKALGALQRGAGTAWAAILAGAKAAIPVILAIGRAILGPVVWAVRTFINIMRGAWQIVGPILSLVADLFLTLGSVVARVVRNNIAAWRRFFDFLEPVARPVAQVVGAIFDALGGAISAVAGVVQAAWASFFSWLAERIRFAVDAARGLMALVRRGANSDLTDLASGQRQLALAGRAPTNATSAAAVVAGRTSNRSSAVNIDKVEVNTQATDAAGVSRAIGSSLATEMRRAAQDVDDGVDR